MAVLDVASADLRRAVAVSRSWRSALRALGLPLTSRQGRLLRSRCDEEGIDYGHFVYRRGWSEAQLSQAIARAVTWDAVALSLGYEECGERLRSSLGNHALRLGLDTSHLNPADPSPASRSPFDAPPDRVHLRSSGALVVAAALALTGHRISWPLEPVAYDLAVDTGCGLQRVQVKTTTTKDGGTWLCNLSRRSSQERAWYSPEDVDYFGVVDGDLEVYMIPLGVVAGLSAISVRKYAAYRLARLGDGAR